MSETLQNAPLVEIVAELRWQVPQLAGVDSSGNPTQLPFMPADNEVEAFFHRVTSAVSKHGFNHLERLAPLGLPVLLPQIVYRYRRTDEQPVLAQIGPGLFSVNALPPYKSWMEFRPWLEKGVEALLEAFQDGPVLMASLRYIDAFKQNLTEGRPAKEFATEVLGFQLELPESLRATLAGNGPYQAALQVTLPVPNMQMAITLSDGQLAGDTAVLMNTEIRIVEPLQPDKECILSALDKAHELAHETFMGMTQSIRDKLQPVQS